MSVEETRVRKLLEDINTFIVRKEESPKQEESDALKRLKGYRDEIADEFNYQENMPPKNFIQIMKKYEQDRTLFASRKGDLYDAVGDELYDEFNRLISAEEEADVAALANAVEQAEAAAGATEAVDVYIEAERKLKVVRGVINELHIISKQSFTVEPECTLRRVGGSRTNWVSSITNNKKVQAKGAALTAEKVSKPLEKLIGVIPGFSINNKKFELFNTENYVKIS